ncbi:OmpA family protein [Streptomyces sp. NPDC059740]|uniref:OmpA family protein n=1 Tax=Streptomyces sp. NPDC059740 TaxID=3346926 RepID=UPI0036697F1C
MTARPRPLAVALPALRRGAVPAAAVVLLLTTAQPATAAPNVPSIPMADGVPGIVEDSSPPVPLDTHDPDLRMVEGATLAPAKVLNIKSIVESDGGEERRQDTNSNVTFALQAEVLFGKDSSKLGGDARSRIDTIAAEIKKQNAEQVRVFGFTDDLGSSAHGLVLSKARANAVQRELATKLGATVAFQIRGYGEQYPIADNSTEDGRKKNRRVEVSFPRTDS